MFDDINLLPDKMRDKEKNLHAHEAPLPKPKIEYSKPEPTRHEDKGHNVSSSWWQKLNDTQVNLFGKKNVKSLVEKKSYQTLPEEKAGEVVKTEFKPANKISWWQKLWGKGAKPAQGVIKLDSTPKETVTSVIKTPLINKEIDSADNSIKSKKTELNTLQDDKVNEVIKPKIESVIKPESVLNNQTVNQPTGGSNLLVSENKVNHQSELVRLATEVIKPTINKPIEHSSAKLPEKKSAIVSQVKSAVPPITKTPLPDVNLIPSEQRFVSLTKTYIILISSFIVGVIIVAIGYFGLSAYNEKIIGQSMSDQANLIKEQDNLDKEITQSEMSLAIKMRLDNFSEVIKHHTSWNEVFNLIENNTLTSVAWTTFAGDASGKISMSGEAPNYTVVAKQLKALQSLKSIPDVSLTGLGQKRDNSNIITFQIVITLNPDVFVLVK